MRVLRAALQLLRLHAVLLLLCAVLLAAGGALQNYVENRRVEAHLVWTSPDKKDSLEAGLMALGGFRGLIADALWVRALSQQDAGRYYELKLLCDMIQKLQPTFAQVHAYQAYNMAYNLAYHSATCEDKWYWMRSALQTLEQGIARNEHSYALWFELGYHYFDRLSDPKLLDKSTGQDCRSIRLAELPRLDDLNTAQRAVVFSHPENWQKGRARNDENVRFAAYYFYKSLQTGTDPNPLRTERIFGNCLDRLGHFRSKKTPEENWDDWGSEEWWHAMQQRNVARGIPNEPTATQNLQFCLMAQMDLYRRRADTAANPAEKAANQGALADAYRRYGTYFPTEKRPMAELLEAYRKIIERNARFAPSAP